MHHGTAELNNGCSSDSTNETSDSLKTELGTTEPITGFISSYNPRREAYDVYTPCTLAGASSAYEFLDESSTTEMDKNWAP